MIGDSVFDLQMAHRAGVDSVAVGYGAQPLHVLQQFEPRPGSIVFGARQLAALHGWF